MALQRDHARYDIAAMPWLPQLPDQWAKDIYDQIEERERTWVAPTLSDSDYEIGIAEVEDQLGEIRGVDAGHVFMAEHATSPYYQKDSKYRFAEPGTGGLVALLGERFGTGLIMQGRQTDNVPWNPNSPITRRMVELLQDAKSMFSVHGMASRKFATPYDNVDMQVMIGLGINPTEELRELASKIATIGRESLGLYVAIGNNQQYYVQNVGATTLKRNEDGTPYIHSLQASKPTMTVNVAREANPSVPTLQVELTNLLHWTPLDGAGKEKDTKARIIGTALGYKFMEMAVESINVAQAESQ